MQIESGKYYRTRDGRKVGPIEHAKDYDKEYPWWYDDGVMIFDKNGGNAFNRHSDLIAEWQDELADDMEWTEIKETEPKEYIHGRIETADAPIELAALSAQHCIKITVQVGEDIIEYDGRV